MAKSNIQFDESDHGIVIFCAVHQYWSAFRFFKPDARDVAVRHEQEKHPGEHHHRDLARQRARHARKKAIQK